MGSVVMRPCSSLGLGLCFRLFPYLGFLSGEWRVTLTFPIAFWTVFPRVTSASPSASKTDGFILKILSYVFYKALDNLGTVA